ADMNLPAAATEGDPNQVELLDLDASNSFFVFPTVDNSVAIGHPGGRIELNGVEHTPETDSFTDLGTAITLQNVLEAPAPEPEQEAINGILEDTGGELTPLGAPGTGELTPLGAPGTGEISPLGDISPLTPTAPAVDEPAGGDISPLGDIAPITPTSPPLGTPGTGVSPLGDISPFSPIDSPQPFTDGTAV
ncbi:MAG: hypothetical protein H5T99_07835, partial [Moorella sp. (in: Bacteria)]|nr:hypothetical protein [Moorella sp. (in: firmicutes)]